MGSFLRVEFVHCVWFPYLAGVHAAFEAGAEHVSSDMVAVNLRLSAGVLRDEPDASLLQGGVTLSLCQRAQQVSSTVSHH